MPPKLDISVDQAQISQDAVAELAALKAGSELRLHVDAATRAVDCVCSTSGVNVAKLHGDMGRRAAAAGDTATVRSLKRDPQTGAVVSIQLRVQPSRGRGSGASEHPTATQSVNGGLQIADDAQYLLKQEQYEQLVGSSELQLALKDERLQRLLCKIDGAGNREQALDAALEGADFRAFADKLLACIGGEQPGGGPS